MLINFVSKLRKINIKDYVKKTLDIIYIKERNSYKNSKPKNLI